MSENLNSVLGIINGLSLLKDLYNNPKKLDELSVKAASAIALTDKEKLARSEYEQFMAQALSFKEKIESHEANQSSFAKEMQEKIEAFENMKKEYAAELSSKRKEVEHKLSESVTAQQQMNNKHSVLRDEWKKKEAFYHEWKRKLDDQEGDLSRREKKLAQTLEGTK